VYGSGHVTIPEMVRAGLVLNVLSIVLITALVLVLAPWVFGTT
jgi:sodium-dependent dicarboxylate transporter 2/3/5